MKKHRKKRVQLLLIIVSIRLGNKKIRNLIKIFIYKVSFDNHLFLYKYQDREIKRSYNKTSRYKCLKII